MRFCLIYKIWALVLGLYLGDVIKSLLIVLGPFLIPFWACVLGRRIYYFKPHQFLMMSFSTRTGLERVGIAGPELELSLGRFASSGLWTPLQKQETKRIGGGSPVAAPMPKSVLFAGENINCLENEVLVHKSAYLSQMGWPGIYSMCFSQLDGDKDSLLLDGGFFFLITVRLIKDNWKAVIGELSYFSYW